jgi:hypothetical protein
MANLSTVRYGKYITSKTSELGNLASVGGNGSGGIEKLAKTNRLTLTFEAYEDTTKIVTAITLDRDEAVKLAKRILAGGTISDILELAKG